MNRTGWTILFAALAALVVVLNTAFIVPQTHQALVLQFGRAVGSVNVGANARPGLFVKAPFLQDVVMFDKRNLGATLPGTEPIVTADQQRLVVDAFVRWRIVNPLRFYQSLQNEEGAEARLRALTNGALRRVLGAVTSTEVISGRRAELMRAITQDIQTETAPFGIQVIDVRIRQADLPMEVAERVFERMRTERQKVAGQIRAQGEEQSLTVRAEADRERTVILATAREESQKVRGAADAERAKIFANSFGRDPEFARFYRSLQAYEKAIPPGTPVVIPPEGEFFRYFRDQDGRP